MSTKKGTKEKKRGKPSKEAKRENSGSRDGSDLNGEKVVVKKMNWKSLPRPGKRAGKCIDSAPIDSGRHRQRSISNLDDPDPTLISLTLSQEEVREEESFLSQQSSSEHVIPIPRLESTGAKRSTASPQKGNRMRGSQERPRFAIDFQQYELVASTNTGEVYRVQSKQTKEFFAVKKICFPHFDESHQSYNQLLFEAKTLAQLSHPNIVQYYNSWIELSEPTNAGKPLEETFQSFLLQLPNTGNCRKSYPGLDDGSLSESIDSSITAITFTEYNLTSDADQFGDDASDDATDNDFVGENENFPFGDDVVSTQRLLTNQRVTLYILMELCSTTLQEYLDQRRRVDETLSLQIFTQILLGVQYLHGKNLMHRDLRPSNIFIFQQANGDGQGDIVKIGDFSVSTDQVPYLITNGQSESGLPMDTSEDDGIQSPSPNGDYTYASPEQRRGAQCNQSVRISCDVATQEDTDWYYVDGYLFSRYHLVCPVP